VIVASHQPTIQPEKKKKNSPNDGAGGRLEGETPLSSSSYFHLLLLLHFISVGELLEVDNESIIFPDGFSWDFFFGGVLVIPSVFLFFFFYPLVLILGVPVGRASTFRLWKQCY
jgi:hypothetical protein